MEPSEAKRKRFSRLSEEEIQNLIEGKDSENTRKATKNAVVTFLAYWNEVKPEDERVKNTESLEKIPKKELNELLANFWPNAKKQNGDSYKKSALMGIRFGLQRHFLLKREFDIISDGEFSKSNQIFEAAIVELKRQGFGKVDHHIPISKEDLEKIQSSYNPSSPDPKSLQQVVWFNIMFHLIRQKISDSSRKNRSPCRLTQLGKSLFIKLLMNWTKTTGQTINQMILQGKDVCMKDLRVPTVQLKLLNFIYLS